MVPLTLTLTRTLTPTLSLNLTLTLILTLTLSLTLTLTLSLTNQVITCLFGAVIARAVPPLTMLSGVAIVVTSIFLYNSKPAVKAD